MVKTPYSILGENDTGINIITVEKKSLKLESKVVIRPDLRLKPTITLNQRKNFLLPQEVSKMNPPFHTNGKHF